MWTRCPRLPRRCLGPVSHYSKVAGKRNSPLLQPAFTEGSDSQNSKFTRAQSLRTDRPWWSSSKIRKESFSLREIPTSPRQLVLHLIRMKHEFPRYPFIIMMDFHNRYPSLQSCDSFNFLLELACSFKRPDAFELVERAMERRGFTDRYSKRLRVRHLAIRGNREAALRLSSQFNYNAVPPDFIAEVLQTPSRHLRQNASASSFHITLVLQALNSTSTDDIEPALLNSLIRYLRYTHQYHLAVALTAHYIRLLPLNPDSLQHNTARELVHQHLSLPPATVSKKPPIQLPGLQEILPLLRLHPQLHPTSRTLSLALEWLRRRRRRGKIGLRMLHEWKKEWGDVVESSEVRRKIASFALSDGDLTLAEKLVNQEVDNRLGDWGNTSASITLPTVADGLDEGTWNLKRDIFLWRRLINRLENAWIKEGNGKKVMVARNKDGP